VPLLAGVAAAAGAAVAAAGAAVAAGAAGVAAGAGADATGLTAGVAGVADCAGAGVAAGAGFAAGAGAGVTLAAGAGAVDLAVGAGEADTGFTGAWVAVEPPPTGVVAPVECVLDPVLLGCEEGALLRAGAGWELAVVEPDWLCGADAVDVCRCGAELLAWLLDGEVEEAEVDEDGRYVGFWLLDRSAGAEAVLEERY
jgi:hypothetical protein